VQVIDKEYGQKKLLAPRHVERASAILILVLAVFDNELNSVKMHTAPVNTDYRETMGCYIKELESGKGMAWIFRIPCNVIPALVSFSISTCLNRQ
jgi:hypothetical protein